jgi:hypothetical protein
MEVEYNMYSFINHKSLSHLAIPYFYFVNNENIVKKLDSDCLYDPKCISDNLFDTFLRSEIDKEEQKPKQKPKQKVKINNTKKNKKKYGSFTRKYKK